MKVCPEHEERVTPMIFTFAFPGCEYFCPYCGNRGGMFGTADDADETPELTKRADDDLEYARPYLTAIGLHSCSQTKYKGEWVDPKDLPAEEWQKAMNTIREWKLIRDTQEPT